MNRIYGFEGEVKAKYNTTMFELFTACFHCLPLAYCLGKMIYITHGGLFSRDDVMLDDIRKVDRFREPPDEGIMSEALWSDPQPMPGRAPSKRGVGLSFGPDVRGRGGRQAVHHLLGAQLLRSDGQQGRASPIRSQRRVRGQAIHGGAAPERAADGVCRRHAEHVRILSFAFGGGRWTSSR